ncbi:MAG: hypothetical protein JXR84_13360 [Anaerolineae bacterium]|nr:hypothetical protein [Anaerolineae bacterium]
MQVKYIVIGVIVVALLAGAAFVGGRLLGRTKETNGPQAMMLSDGDVAVMHNSGGALGGMMAVGGGPGGAQPVTVKIEPAPELPARAPDVAGQLKRVEDNSIFVGTGDVGFMVRVDEAGNTETNIPEATGPEVEVVVTRDTKVYRDMMQPPTIGSGEDVPSVMQQKITLITLDDIGEQGAISAWGQKRGDRVIAEVVLYIGF